MDRAEYPPELPKAPVLAEAESPALPPQAQMLIDKIGEHAYRSWFAGCVADRIEDDALFFRVPSAFIRHRIMCDDVEPLCAVFSVTRVEIEVVDEMRGGVGVSDGRTRS